MQYNKDLDYYQQLGLTDRATNSEIKKKFYKLAKKHHPDSCESKADDEEKFKKITAAYDVLSNMTLKRQYDAERSMAASTVGGNSRGGNAGPQNGKPFGDFNMNYQARQSRTYTYRAGQQNGAPGSGGQSYQRQGQQSYEEWSKENEPEDDYNYFYKDAREQGAEGGSDQKAHHDFRSDFGGRSQGSQQYRSYASAAQGKKVEQGGLGLLVAYSIAGMLALQMCLLLVTGGGAPGERAKKIQQGGATMPGGRSPGSISAIYSGLDQQQALEVRQRGSKQSESDKINEQALRERGAAKQEKVIVMAKSRDVRNPADDQIKKYRKEGLQVPKDLLEKKHSFNKQRHEKDIKKQHDFLQAKLSASEAILADIAQMNRAAAEQGLPTLSGGSASDSVVSSDVEESPLVNGTSYVAGKILKPPGQGNSEPFLQQTKQDDAAF